ncbi:hypothetical protein TRIP_C60098 [Candidatus Zixiibacteriota bacterium]|nr:hypothetical protein TRIP_C60098 [candidate division Zixibacteria bacterium]
MKYIKYSPLFFIILFLTKIDSANAIALTPDQESRVRSIIRSDSTVINTRMVFLKDSRFDRSNDTIVIREVIRYTHDSIAYTIVKATYLEVDMAGGGNRWITLIFNNFDTPPVIFHNALYGIKLLDDIIPGKLLIFYSVSYSHGFTIWNEILAEFGKKGEPLANLEFFSYDKAVEDSVIFEDLDGDKIKEILVRVHTWGESFDKNMPPVDTTEYSVYKYIADENKFKDCGKESFLMKEAEAYWKDK